MLRIDPVSPLSEEERDPDFAAARFVELWKHIPLSVCVFQCPPAPLSYLLACLEKHHSSLAFHRDEDDVSINTETLCLFHHDNVPRRVAQEMFSICLALTASTPTFRDLLRLGIMDSPNEFQLVRYNGSRSASFLLEHSDATGDTSRLGTFVLCVHKSPDIVGGDVYFPRLQDVLHIDEMCTEVLRRGEQGFVLSQSVGTAVAFWSRNASTRGANKGSIIDETRHSVSPITGGTPHAYLGHKAVIVIFFRFTVGFLARVQALLPGAPT